jgi:hypothetical protein
MFEFVKSKAFIVSTVVVVVLAIIITVVVAVRDNKYKAASVSSIMPKQINTDDRLKAYKMHGFAAEGCFNVSPSIFTTYIANPTTIEACAKEVRSKGGQFMYITGAKDTGTLRVYYGSPNLSATSPATDATKCMAASDCNPALHMGAWKVGCGDTGFLYSVAPGLMGKTA